MWQKNFIGVNNVVLGGLFLLYFLFVLFYILFF